MEQIVDLGDRPATDDGHRAMQLLLESDQEFRKPRRHHDRFRRRASAVETRF